MKLVFSPAELLMNRLSYPVKFGVIGLLVFLAFASLMLTIAGQLNRTIERAESELVASSLARPLSRLIELTSSTAASRRCCWAATVAGRRDALQTSVATALAEWSGRSPKTSARCASGKTSAAAGRRSSAPA